MMRGLDVVGVTLRNPLSFHSTSGGSGTAQAKVKGAVSKLQASAKKAQAQAKKVGKVKSKSSKPSSQKAKQGAQRFAAKLAQLAKAAAKHANAVAATAKSIDAKKAKADKDHAAQQKAQQQKSQAARSGSSKGGTSAKRGGGTALQQFQQAQQPQKSMTMSRVHGLLGAPSMNMNELDPSQGLAIDIASLGSVVDAALQFSKDLDDASLMADIVSQVQPLVDQLNSANPPQLDLANQGSTIITNANNFAANIQPPADPSTDGSSS